MTTTLNGAVRLGCNLGPQLVLLEITTVRFLRPRYQSSANISIAWEEKREEVNYCDDDDPNSNSNSNSGVTLVGSSQSNTDKMLIAHGAIAALVFAILFPFGAIGMRLASFTGLVWVHAAVQGFAYLLYIVAFGLGVHIANEKGEVSATLSMKPVC
jgi:hypothetical protein